MCVRVSMLVCVSMHVGLHERHSTCVCVNVLGCMMSMQASVCLGMLVCIDVCVCACRCVCVCWCVCVCVCASMEGDAFVSPSH